MKLFYLLVILLFLSSCSFDSKTGIWNSEDKILKELEGTFKDFKKVAIEEVIFNETIIFKGTLKDKISKPKKNKIWNDIYFNPNNNFGNYKYNNLNHSSFKSIKLTKNLPDIYKIYDGQNLIINDDQGNIIVFSIIENRVITKFNFYKKKFKKIKKKINFIVENKLIFVTDNLGYAYVFNYQNNKILWAKNYKIPFSSNLKILGNKLLASNQENKLYILNKNNGDLLRSIPTEETSIKSKFTNNLSTNNKDRLFFLNSFGSLYSIDMNTMRVSWFNNFNKSFDLSPSDLFSGKEIVNINKEIILSSNFYTYLINSETGSIIKKFNFSLSTKPIINNNIGFFLTKNNFLIAIDLVAKNILYSYDITKIKELNIEKNKSDIYKRIMILNSEIFIFLNNSKILNFSIDGQFKNVKKLPSKIFSLPISIQDSILYLNNKNKLVIVN